MCGLRYRALSLPIFIENSILPLKSLDQYKSCLYIHGFINSYIHTNRPIILNSNVHDHNTRQRDILHLFRNHTLRNGCRSIFTVVYLILMISELYQGN
jgi:hypothetical protein